MHTLSTRARKTAQHITWTFLLGLTLVGPAAAEVPLPQEFLQTVRFQGLEGMNDEERAALQVLTRGAGLARILGEWDRFRGTTATSRTRGSSTDEAHDDVEAAVMSWLESHMIGVDFDAGPDPSERSGEEPFVRALVTSVMRDAGDRYYRVRARLFRRPIQGEYETTEESMNMALRVDAETLEVKSGR